MIYLYKVLEEAKVIYSKKKRKAIACIVCGKIDLEETCGNFLG